MAKDEMERLLNEIGNVLAQDADYPLEGTFLYTEAAAASADISIFKDLGDHLLFRWPMSGLSDVLLELWAAEAPDKRWAAMQYRIEGGRFDASFTYPEAFDPAEWTGDRRERVLQQRYGNKRVVYPPI